MYNLTLLLGQNDPSIIFDAIDFKIFLTKGYISFERIYISAIDWRFDDSINDKDA